MTLDGSIAAIGPTCATGRSDTHRSGSNLRDGVAAAIDAVPVAMPRPE